MKRALFVACAALALAACDPSAQAPGDRAAPAPDATASGASASGTAPDAPVLTPAPRGQDGQFGKIPPGDAAAAPVAPEPQPEQPAVDDSGGEEKP